MNCGCCAALVRLWTGVAGDAASSSSRGRGFDSGRTGSDDDEALLREKEEEEEKGGGDVEYWECGVGKSGEALEDDQAMMPSTLSKYEKVLLKHEKRVQKKLNRPLSLVEAEERKSSQRSLDETNRLLRDFLKGSDAATTTSSPSVSESSSSESLLNGTRVSSVDEIIRRFRTRIPVHVLVSYFDEYHRQLRRKDGQKAVEMKGEIKQLAVKLSQLSLAEKSESDESL